MRFDQDARSMDQSPPDAPVLQTAAPYRREGDFTLIEIRLASLRQMFNSLDPAPFHSKDLDADAEAFIVGAIRELPSDQPAKLIVYLPENEAGDAHAGQLPGTVRNYFTYRAQIAARELRLELREARNILIAGLIFLGVCLSLRQLLLGLDEGTLMQWLAEGLLIVGWVGMWRPLEAVLYDWWPTRRRQRIFARLAAVPVEIRAAQAARR